MASLNTVGTALGKTGSPGLSGSTEAGYTRTRAASGYNRINPFQAANGTAPSEFVAPHSLDAWASYSHTTVNSGTQLAKSGGYQSLDVTWTLPTGYSNDTANLTQKVYWKLMGSSENLTINPFSTPTGTASAADGTSYTITGLVVDRYYAVGTKVEWDDSTTTYTNTDALAYNISGSETALTGTGRGISSGIIYNDTPTMGTVVQDTAEGSCLIGCTSCVQLTANFTMTGPSRGTLQEKVDAGSWTTLTSNLGAGSTSYTVYNRDDGKTYNYRLRYNDVSPNSWSGTGSKSTVCTKL